MSKKLMYLVCFVLLTVWSVTPAKATLITSSSETPLSSHDSDIYLGVEWRSTGLGALTLRLFEWLKIVITTDFENETEIWAEVNVTKLLIGLHDDEKHVRKGYTEPTFDTEDDWGCSLGELGGPPGYEKTYWQTVQVSGNSMQAGEYYAISISEAPFHNNQRQDFFWVYATPEPATICLLGLGGLALRRRRRA